ncbi:MAG: hypothetical protein ACYC9S_09855 [Leptospirales bacterium]
MNDPALFDFRRFPLWPREPLCGADGSLVVLKGPRSSMILHEIAAWHLMEEGPVIFICGDNTFSPEILLRRSRDAGASPRSTLSRIHLSRAFTIHQFSSAVINRLEEALERFKSRIALISGIVPLFYDNAVPLPESLRILEQSLDHLNNLADRGYGIVIAFPDPREDPHRRHRMVLSRVLKHADRFWEED